MDQRVTSYIIHKTVFRVMYGDITTIDADAIVSSDDNHLTMGGGVSRAILLAGGDVIRQEARKHIPLNLGEVAVTSAGDLPAKFVFHAVTIDYDNWLYANEESIRSATRKCLMLADTLGVHHIAFPALGTGVARFPFQLAAEIMTRTIADYLMGDTGIEIVTLTLYPRNGVTFDDLNIFYERATSLASLSVQAKRLQILISELSSMVREMGRPDLANRIAELQDALLQAQDTLMEQPTSIERLEQIHQQSGLLRVSQEVVKASSDVLDVWANRQVEVQVLRTKLQGLQAVLNVQFSNLNRLKIEKAKYGGIGVPPRLENAISDVEREIKETESQIVMVRRRLVALAGDM